MTLMPGGPRLETVLITPIDLQQESLSINEIIPAGAIDYAVDTRQVGPLPVEGKADLLVEHRGPQEQVEDIRLRASYAGEFEVLCARCLDPVAVPLKGSFDLLFRPENVDAEAGERALSEDETEIGYYEKNGLQLEDVVREQVLLALPGKTICRDDCKGLCADCGTNLNAGACDCSKRQTLDPRWNALAGLAGSLKQ